MDISYTIKTGKPFKNYSLDKLKSFLNNNDLSYDEKISFSIVIVDSSNNIIATGSLDHNIIKCVAIDKNHRNENLTSSIITQLINESIKNNNSKLFIFTKIENEKIFQQLGFYTIEKTNKILLMENNKTGFTKYLNSIKEESKISTLLPRNKIGCIVANCNPFTNGHLYLINEAANQCDILHIFILSGDNEFFSEDERFSLVKEGLKDIYNIILHRAKEYILSPLTFPSYFIKDKIQTTSINCELDIKIFLNKIVPLLNINYRFVGTEPKDLVTNSYNNELIKNLKDSPVKLIILDRKEIDGKVISASTVRKLIENKNLNELKKYVPKTTYEFIKLKFFPSCDSNK